ncbi:hypothetical protein J2W32_000357 [Variovorax boronicumulans]|uniref:Phasin domain-containing protein n=1 Tax=Variovorax boronicumulans TaxID=436515 RepID=A0AAW8CW98_9BURK|nr:hypothetical protein [Variovorax boronicumulans]MDP9891260.1 hypothetical protein [Variovorax boronicumulans]MDQ0051328.1 hypothetical protein [Variovorax boronicumulans]
MTRTSVLLTPSELQTSMRPLRAAAKALRVGVATEVQWDQVRSSVQAAQVVEQRVMPLGVSEHLQSAQTALQAIAQRAMATGAWRAAEIYLQEIDHIMTAVDLHEWQLLQLSAAEAQRYVPKPPIQTLCQPTSDVGQLQGVLA